MRRIIIALGLSGVLLLAGSGQAAATDPDAANAATAPQQAGFENASSGTTPGVGPRRVLRKNLRKNTLHGEITIKTKNNGVRTVVVQRGSVTAVTATSMSVKSSDGFTLTWTFGDKLRIVQDRKSAGRSALKTGTQIGIAGFKDGTATAARLIRIG